MRAIDAEPIILMLEGAREIADSPRRKLDLLILQNVIELSPTVDATPVMRGRWEEIRDPYGALKGWIHTECGREVKCAENYCPTCGAKMDLPEDGD